MRRPKSTTHVRSGLHPSPDERQPGVAEDAPNTQYITLTEATKLIPGRDGRRISLKSIHRWCRKGLRDGIRLRSELVGGKRCTTRHWLNEFIGALTQEAEPDELARSVPRRNSDRQQASERAVEALKDAWEKKRR